MVAAPEFIDHLPLKEVKPYSKNSRNHNEAQLKSLCAAIREYGFTNPILIDESKTIIAGHGRYEAAKRLRLETIPTITISHLSPEQQRAYVIADNKLSDMSTWDNENLISELADLASYQESLDDNLKGFFDQSSFNPYKVQEVDVALLKPHPRNYREHPQQQIEHLAGSIAEYGFYRNVIVAKDYTILAGHGLTQAAIFAKIKTVPILKLQIDPSSTKALKLLAIDNEVDHLGDTDMRQLSEILKDILKEDDLFGTGYDEAKLQNLLTVSRSKQEVESYLPESDWGDLVDFEKTDRNPKIVVNFENETDRQDFINALGISLSDKAKAMWWPMKERKVLKDKKYEAQ